MSRVEVVSMHYYACMTLEPKVRADLEIDSRLGRNLVMRQRWRDLLGPLHTWPVEPRGQTPNSSLKVKQKFIKIYYQCSFVRF